MNEKNLLLLSPDELPQTDEVQEELKINNVQENLIYLMEKKKLSLADVQKATMIPWSTLYGWYKGDVKAQLLDINIKELADFFDVSINSLAFDDLKQIDLVA